MEGKMLMAYEDLGFKIKDIPMEEARVPLCPIDGHAAAVRILEKAKIERPEVSWVIVGSGPYGVHGLGK
jgi:hypothetical protein